MCIKFETLNERENYEAKVSDEKEENEIVFTWQKTLKKKMSFNLMEEVETTKIKYKVEKKNNMNKEGSNTLRWCNRK